MTPTPSLVPGDRSSVPNLPLMANGLLLVLLPQPQAAQPREAVHLLGSEKESVHEILP